VEWSLMRYAINVPNFGDYADPDTFVRLARSAEAADWDGLFVWDHMLIDRGWDAPIADPWTLLAAAAAVTDQFRLGPRVTPLPRRRPWVVARQGATLDALSHGRLTLGVGLGAPADAEFAAFGEDASPAVRAARLDEGLAIIDGLWRGEEVTFNGRHHQLDRVRFTPRPVQAPRIPIWVAGYWPHRSAFRRAAEWDGVFPASRATDETGAPIPIDELEQVLAVVRAARGPRGMVGFDVMVAGGTPADPAAARAIVDPYEHAGATWWSEGLNGWRGSLGEMEAHLAAGPPARGAPGSAPAQSQ
jgi:alkanesulfonate monooxygenase SsuD/methylene tetrahydromethanopterin reductase-like flavin-dependent oxidoreductase (luciferase family)